MTYRYVLPWGPSFNSSWRSPNRGPLAGRHLLSSKAREFRKAAIAEIIEQGRPEKPLTCRIWVTIEISPPDRRRRDISNWIKATEDALVHAGVIKDDSQVDHLEVDRITPTAGGRIFVVVGQL